MSAVDFQHITTSMVGEVAVVEILAKELRFRFKHRISKPS